MLACNFDWTHENLMCMSVKADKPEHEFTFGIARAAELRSNSLSIKSDALTPK